MIQNMIGLKRN